MNIIKENTVVLCTAPLNGIQTEHWRLIKPEFHYLVTSVPTLRSSTSFCTVRIDSCTVVSIPLRVVENPIHFTVISIEAPTRAKKYVLKPEHTDKRPCIVRMFPTIYPASSQPLEIWSNRESFALLSKWGLVDLWFTEAVADLQLKNKFTLRYYKETLVELNHRFVFTKKDITKIKKIITLSSLDLGPCRCDIGAVKIDCTEFTIEELKEVVAFYTKHEEYGRTKS